MSEQYVKFLYQKRIIAGSYSFSASNNTIILPEYVEKLENARIREAIEYEAEKARSFYVAEIDRLKKIGIKADTLLIKREATQKAKEEAKIKYADVWDEAKKAHTLFAPSTTPIQPITPNLNSTDNKPTLKEGEVIILITGSDNPLVNLKRLTKVIETNSATNQYTIKDIPLAPPVNLYIFSLN